MGNPFTFIAEKASIEYQHFLSHPRDMRTLLVTNMIYALVLPVIEIFVGAYIMRNSNNPSMVAFYQLAVYTGIPFTFWINGYLLNHFKISNLYSFGMLLSGCSMIAMMSLDGLSYAGIGVSGLIMGMSFGFFWANRDFLALNTTNDNNRNYYYGLETFFYVTTFIIVPLSIGAIVTIAAKEAWFGGNINVIYYFITAAVIMFTIIASIVVHSEKFKNPTQKKFVYWKFDRLWNKMLVLAVLKGIGQGYLVTAPAMLIMTLVGDEGSLGALQAISGIITAILLYLLGRLTKPKHRIYIFIAGLIVFAVGAGANALLFSALGVIIFVLGKTVFQPLYDIAYFPIQLKVIDVVSLKEKRSEFAYIFNHEFGLYVGRFFGLVLFILLARYLSTTFALRYSILIIALIQLLAIPMAKNIIKSSYADYKSKDPILEPVETVEKVDDGKQEDMAKAVHKR